MHLVEQQPFRDFVIPLLSCVPESRNNDEFTTVTYDKLHNVLINCQHIDTVSIEVKTDQKNHVSFYFGKSL